MASNSPNNNSKTYLRMFIYFATSILITFFSLVDTIEADKISDLSQFDWIKLLVKSFVPSLISIKAYFDDTHAASIGEKADDQ
jgi:hypothetical protein